MLTFLSPAKTISIHASSLDHEDRLSPRLLSHAQHIISQICHSSVSELEKTLRISSTLAHELHERYQLLRDHRAFSAPAIDAYDGVVFKHMRSGGQLSKAQRHYLQQHTRICSMLYGLLRPLDHISPYRMEGYVKLPQDGMRVDRYWRDILTPLLITDVQEAGGVMIYLASKEEKQAFHWKQVEAAVRVIQINFLQKKGNQLRQVVVYTKMARGEMLGYMAREQITNAKDLQHFTWDDYHYAPHLSTEDEWVWLRDADQLKS